MTATRNIDMTEQMAEVTRLTRAGRLADAMALLQGRATAAPPPRSEGSGATARGAGRHAVIDMVAPAGPGAAWTAPGLTASGTAAVPSGLQAMLDGLGPLVSSGTMPGRAAPVPDGARFELRSLAHGAGQRRYKLYVPSGLDGAQVPLVVMLHGCTQSPDDFAAGTRMNELAEEQRFLVAYPEQTQAANASKCWNWFNPADQGRDGGEPSLIAGITRQILRDESVDPARVYVAGLSAGGAAAAIMGATHPDLFAAIGVHSGLACGAARDMPSAFKAMRQGGTPGPARKRARDGERGSVAAIVFHGDGRPDRQPGQCRSGGLATLGRGFASPDAGRGRSRAAWPSRTRSIATATIGQCWSNGCCTARATPGRAAPRPGRSPTHAARTPAGRCCGSSCSTRTRAWNDGTATPA